jgi:hypothetical protein
MIDSLLSISLSLLLLFSPPFLSFSLVPVGRERERERERDETEDDHKRDVRKKEADLITYRPTVSVFIP